MDPNDINKATGRGRGSFLLEMMRKAQNERSQMTAHSVETPSISSRSEGYSSQSVISQSVSSSSSGGRGRAQLVTLLKSMSSSESDSRESASAIGHGRGSLSSLMKKLRWVKSFAISVYIYTCECRVYRAHVQYFFLIPANRVHLRKKVLKRILREF